MSKNRSQQRLFHQLIQNLEPKTRRAFEAVIAEMKAGIDWKALVKALTDKNIDAAIDALNIEASVFERYRSNGAETYAAGGALAVQTINLPPASNIRLRFNPTNPAAEAWIKRNVADRIVEKLIPETVESVRKTILTGFQAGRHPNNIALDIGGRMVGGRRQGGILGLDPQFSSYVDSMRLRLSSGDAAEMQKVFGMTLRDKRYDARLMKAIKGERKLTASEIETLVGRYNDRLLKLRAETIARTETGMAVMQSRKDAWDQALVRMGREPDAVVKTWVAGGGAKDPRPHHQALGGKKVRGLNTPFSVGGVEMQHALDSAGGAKECANCTCGTNYTLDYMHGVS